MAQRYGAVAAAAIVWVLAFPGLMLAEDGGIEVEIGTVEAGPGQRVAVPVVLHTNGASVVSFQNDILFSPEASPLPVEGGSARPDCWQDPTLLPGLLGSRFGFRHGQHCEPDGGCTDGLDDTSIRAVVSVSGTGFPDETAVVYTCTVQVAPDAELGRYPMECENVFASDRDGGRIPGTCAAGAIIVVEDAPPPPPATPTQPPTPGRTRPPTGPLPCASCPLLEVGNAAGQPGEQVAVDVWVRTAGRAIAGVQVQIDFSPEAHIATREDGRPDCAFGSNLAGFSDVAFIPAACGGQTSEACNAMRVLLITAELSELPDDALVLSCAIDIAADAAAGTYALAVSDLLASTAEGQQLALSGTGGAITVRAGLEEGQQPALGGSGGESAAGGGCAIPAATSARGAWWLLGAALLGVWRRTRRPRA